MIYKIGHRISILLNVQRKENLESITIGYISDVDELFDLQFRSF